MADAMARTPRLILDIAHECVSRVVSLDDAAVSAMGLRECFGVCTENIG